MSSFHLLHSCNAIPCIISLVYAGLTTRIVIEHVHSFRNPDPPPLYLVVALTFGAAPFAPCLLAIPPLACPLAALLAVLAFSAFRALSAAAFFSFPSLIAACLAAVRASGRWVRRSLITSREAPTMARWCFTVRRVRFLATSYRAQ